ncbi:MAG: VanZ family protein [Calditrichaeota bacterium]|nr:VanZ family protein [Calditrichota bacterium]
MKRFVNRTKKAAVIKVITKDRYKQTDFQPFMDCKTNIPNRKHGSVKRSDMEDQKTIKTLKTINILTIIFIIYNTLLPFRPYFELSKIIRNLGKVELIPFIVEGKLNPITDLIGNIILFIPFGFFLTLYFIHTRRSQKTLSIVFYGAFLSFCIEVLQIGFRYRTPSTTDILMNTLGTVFGVIGAKIYFRYLARRLQLFLEDILENEPITLVIMLILLVQFFGSLLPFNVTITVSDLKKAIAYTNIQPFGMKPLGLMLGASIKHLDRLTFSVKDFVANILFYSIYGYLVMYSYYQYWKSKKNGKVFLFFLLILYFPALEITQFFIKSRFSDINDIISGYMGAFAGIFLFYLFKKNSWFTGIRKIKIEHFYVIFAIYFIYIFYKSFNPFNFSLDPEVLRQNLRIRYLVPFYAYYKVTTLWNLYDLLESLFILMPLGFVWAFVKGNSVSPQRSEFTAGLIGLIIAVGIEGAQVFLPTRTGEITDVIVMTLGCYAGARFYRYYFQNFVVKENFIRSLGNSG